MTPRQYLQATLSGLMAALAMLGSITGLVAFAAKGQAHVITLPVAGYDLPLGMWAFVACLDGLAIVMALQVHDHERGMDWGALGVLVAVTMASAVLQYLAAPAGWEAKVVYTAPAPLAGVATYAFFRSLSHRTAPAKATKPKARSGGAATTTSRPAPPAPLVEISTPDEEHDVIDLTAAAAKRKVELTDDLIERVRRHPTVVAKGPTRRAVEAAAAEHGVGRVVAGRIRQQILETGT